MDYLGTSDIEKKQMLEYLGIKTIDELYKDIPEDIQFNKDLNIKGKHDEKELSEHMKKLSGKNKPTSPINGAGMYSHYIPSAVKHITGISELYTSYTPYQAEVSQGVLQSLYEYQTMICELTGMDVSNASMYDGSTALAEACLMAHRINKKEKIVITDTLHPEYQEVLQTYLRYCGLELQVLDSKNGITDKKLLKKA